MGEDVFTFPCGCSCPIDRTIPEFHGHPSLIYEVEKAPLTCQATWDLISSGRTKGIFQLESSLGKSWAKRLKPRNIEHLAALISLLRPGCLHARDERGVSMTELYCRRKNGEEPVEIDIEVVRDILDRTYDVIVFQEQFMQISQRVAGFNLGEIDKLRKAGGKKDAKAMTEVGELFVDKAEKLGVITREEAERLFANIKKSARYSFNCCVSSDTRILRPVWNRQSPQSPYTVEEMYRIRNDRPYARATGHVVLGQRWQREGNYGSGLSLGEDGIVRPNLIADIQRAGVRPVYEVTLENAATIRVTGNHKFPTDAGEMTVDQMLGPGDEGYREISLLVFGDRGPSDKQARKGEKCYLAKPVRIASIRPDGDCMTYDVTMTAPHHTFAVESGIITCNSHAVSYAIDSYWTAHEKAHFPTYFFTAYLHFAKEKQKPLEEIRALVNEAKLFDIEVLPPRFSDMEKHFTTNGVEIRFGLSDVKGIGGRKVDKMAGAVAEAEKAVGRPRVTWSWFDFLAYFSGHCDSTTIKRMIEIGALGNFKFDRLRLLAEYDAWSKLTDAERRKVGGLSDPVYGRERVTKEIEVDVPVYDRKQMIAYNKLLKQHELDPAGLEEPEHPKPVGTRKKTEVVSVRDERQKLIYRDTDTLIDPARPVATVADAIKALLLRPGAVSRGRRNKVESVLKALEHPASPLEDKPYWIAKKEEEALGLPISCTHVDAADKSRINTTCKELREGKNERVMIIGVEVQEMREIPVKNGPNKGKKMAYLTVADETGMLDDVTVFSNAWEIYGHMLSREKTVVGLQGSRDRNRGGFLVEKVWEI